MSGMLETKTCSRQARVARPARRERARKTPTSVIPASLDAQTSFAPIRIVTYSALRPITPCTWPDRSAMSAPETAWLYDRPVMPKLTAWMRR